MKKFPLLIALIVLPACTSSMLGPDDRMGAVGHIDKPAPAVETGALDIPPVVEQVPIIAAPEPAEPLQTFTVVATDLPASELLFALARDARLNLDIDPAIEGRVSINAIDQTLPQILQRIARQVSLRYYVDGPNLVVEQDTPFTRIYRVDYLNMSRQTSSSVEISTSIATTGTVEGTAGGGGSGSDSATRVINQASNEFWQTLEDNIGLLANVDDIEGVVISNRESGTISVRTSAKAHDNIQRFLDRVLVSARRQVLIEATVVEVTLNDDFQAGVDWSRIAVGNGWSLQQSVLGANLGTTPFTSATYTHSNADRDISSALKALDSFGDVSVMSSPKIMALNNQTSILKVVDNRVYFTTDIEETTDEDTNETEEKITTTINTVPVGFVMNVTPFITDSEEVILNIRPTISRILRFVQTPAISTPTVTLAPNDVPEVQVREMESVLRVGNGNTAVIGGLMQDTADQQDAGIPGLHRTEGFGFLFGRKQRDYAKTELVIFLRPRIIDNASLETNLRDFKKFLRPGAFSE